MHSSVNPEVTSNVYLAVTGSAEAHVAVRADEGLGASVQTHVHLETALGREARVAHVTSERLVHCRDETRGVGLNFEPTIVSRQIILVTITLFKSRH